MTGNYAPTTMTLETMMSNVTKADIQSTIESLKTAQAAQPTQFSNKSPMRGQYRDNARVVVKQSILDTIEKNNTARDQYCMTPLTDMTGRETIIVSSAKSGHKKAQFANVFRSVSISKTGKANILTTELFSTSESYDDIKKRHINTLKRRGLDVSVIDINSLITDPSSRSGKMHNNYSNKFNLLVTRSENKRGDFCFQSWAFDGHSLTLADVLVLPKTGNYPMSDIDFTESMSKVKSHAVSALNTSDDQVSIRYMGTISQPITLI